MSEPERFKIVGMDGRGWAAIPDPHGDYVEYEAAAAERELLQEYASKQHQEACEREQECRGLADELEHRAHRIFELEAELKSREDYDARVPDPRQHKFLDRKCCEEGCRSLVLQGEVDQARATLDRLKALCSTELETQWLIVLNGDDPDEAYAGKRLEALNAILETIEPTVQVPSYEEVCKERDKLAAEVEKFHAILWLLARDEVFVSADANPFWHPSVEHVEGSGWQLSLNCGDTFAWATADAEPFTLDDAKELARISQEEGWPGLVRWVQARRPGEEPIKPVAEKMRKYDDALASVKAERDRLATVVTAAKNACNTALKVHWMPAGPSQYIRGEIERAEKGGTDA